MDYLSETSTSSQLAVGGFPKFNAQVHDTLLPRPLATPALANVAAIVAENPAAVHENIITSRQHRSNSIDEPRAPDSVGTQLLVNDDKIQPFEQCSVKDVCEDHRPVELPRFQDVQTCMWTASHAANCPSEDRSASLVNLLLQPLPPNFDSETQLPPLEPDYKTLIRLNLWAVVDGHGGGCVATYVSEVLLPHIAASVSRALGCAIVDRGVCTVNGQRRNANALDLDGLIQMTAERSPGNPNSIHYRSPYERSDSEEDARGRDRTNPHLPGAGDDETALLTTKEDTEQVPRLVSGENSFPDTPPGGARSVAGEQASSVKTSVKTAASPATREDLVGTHSPAEVANITQAITESFLAVDEGWINSIDPVATHQTSCHSNGRWNSGACALVVFTVQRLDWTSVTEPGREKEQRDPEKSRLNTCQNRDAARRRMLDYASRAKATSTMSVGSSTSSLTTEEAAHASGIESEITETEGEDDRSLTMENRKKETGKTAFRNPNTKKPSMISPPGGCSCHCYRAHDAIIYTAHVGDCRAVMLGSAPPRTIKVGGGTRADAEVTDDESSHHSSDETECLSSSDHEADSSEDEDLEGAAVKSVNGAPASEFINLPPRRVTREKSAKRRAIDDAAGPYIALPPLDDDEDAIVDSFGLETEIERRERRRVAGKDTGTSDSSTTSQESLDARPLLQLSPGTRPIDLTTDHSAYNPAEVTAVLRRCNNAPRAISAGMGGGIKRVAGSLAVTRALGDAYLKTPKLSFLPYKSHAPYITGRPEVNCRLLVKDGDKVLILATDVSLFARPEFRISNEYIPRVYGKEQVAKIRCDGYATSMKSDVLMLNVGAKGQAKWNVVFLQTKTVAMVLPQLANLYTRKGLSVIFLKRVRLRNLRSILPTPRREMHRALSLLTRSVENGAARIESATMWPM